MHQQSTEDVEYHLNMSEHTGGRSIRSLRREDGFVNLILRNESGKCFHYGETNLQSCDSAAAWCWISSWRKRCRWSRLRKVGGRGSMEQFDNEQLGGEGKQ